MSKQTTKVELPKWQASAISRLEANKKKLTTAIAQKDSISYDIMKLRAELAIDADIIVGKATYPHKF